MPNELEEVTTATLPIKALRPHTSNPRKHPDRQIEKLKKSLQRFGQIKPVVAQRDGNGYRLYAGHGVTEAARRLGWDTLEVKVLPAQWADEQCAGYMLADNQGGEDDEEILIDLWENQLENGFDLESVGISFEEFEAIRAEHDVPMSGAKPERPTMVGSEKAKKQVRIVIALDQIALFEQALRKTGLRNRGEALEKVCKAYLDGDSLDFEEVEF